MRPRSTSLGISVATVLVAAGLATAALTGHWSAVTLEAEDIEDATLVDLTIRASAVRDSSLLRTLVEGSTLLRVDVQHSTLHDSHVREAYLSAVALHGGTVGNSALEHFTSHGTDFTDVHISHALLLGGSVMGGSIDLSTLDRVDLDDVSLCMVFIRDTGQHVNSGCDGAAPPPPPPPPPPPAPDPEPEPTPPWPVEGSFVRWENDGGLGAPVPIEQHTWVNVTFIGGAWLGTCQHVERTTEDFGDKPAGHETWTNTTWEHGLLLGPTDTSEDSVATVDRLFGGCSAPSDEELVVEGQETHTWDAADGKPGPMADPRTAQAWHGVHEPTTAPKDFDAWWDTEFGLLLQWNWCSGSTTSCGPPGWLADTDAPIFLP